MKYLSQNIEPILEPYDDNNLEHVLNGPEYGQPGWSEYSIIDWIEEEIPIDEVIL
jgi:hypothetical protein